MKPGRGKGSGGSVRFNITVPADLRRKMGERPEVNWSRVASDAFAAFLGLPPAPERLTLEDRMAAIEKLVYGGPGPLPPEVPAAPRGG